MKFFKINNFYYEEDVFDSLFFENLYYNSDFYNFELTMKKKKYHLNKIRPGLTPNKKNNSIIRDSNLDLIKQYININQKRGCKNITFKHLNLSLENLFFCFNNSIHDFESYSNYNNLVFLNDTDPVYSDINKILNIYLQELESIFEIKSVKNNKKLNLPNKYSHEIVYLPKKRRFKYVLKALTIYKENFKKYSLWERIFWSFFLTFSKKENSVIAKRKTFICMKSVKFFGKKIKKSK